MDAADIIAPGARIVVRDAEWLVRKSDRTSSGGMACTVKLVAYLKKDALTVPKTAVQSDPLDEQKQYVYVVQKDGKPKKQPVTVGKKTDKVIEIL